MSLLLLFQGARAVAPPTPGAGGGGTGSGWDVGLFWKRKQLEELRRLKFASESEERAELGRYLRELAAGETPATVAMTPAGVRELEIDTQIATLLAKSERAEIVEFRSIVDEVERYVRETLDDEDDVEAILMGMG